MENPTPVQHKKSFSLVLRIRAVGYAIRGLGEFLKETHSAWLQILVFIAVIILGVFFDITETEWIFIVLAAGLVLMAEAFNTAIETVVDLASPNFHPLARTAKDVAAGAVLIAAIASIAVGIIVFAPYIASYCATR